MRDFSNCRSVFRSVVESLLIGVGAWLVGALLFLGGQGVLSLLLVLVGIACIIQLLGEGYLAVSRGMRLRMLFVLVGQVMFLLATPGVSTRYSSKADQLWTFDALHFGIVTASLLGGFVGGLLNTSCWSLGFFRRA